MKRIDPLLLAVLFTLGGTGYVSAGDFGQCVNQCVKQLGKEAKPLCVKACRDGGCPQEVVPVGEPCNPACPNQCETGSFCQETSLGSGQYICK